MSAVVHTVDNRVWTVLGQCLRRMMSHIAAEESAKTQCYYIHGGISIALL